MRRPRPSARLTAALLGLTTVALGVAVASPDPDWAKTAYARVDGVAILRTAVDADVANGWPKDRALKRAITNAVMRTNLVREGFDPGAVTQAELKAMLAETRKRIERGGVNKLETILARSGQTLRQFKESLRIPVCFNKLLKSKLTEERLRELYEKQALVLKGEVRASHILIKVGPKRKAPAARAKAAELIKAIGPKATATSFAAVAQKESEDPLAPLTGGDLDWFRARSREIPGAVIGATFRRGKTGLIGEPIRGRRGFHVILVTGTRLPKGATFERMRDELRARAEAVAAQGTMRAWMRKAKIELASDAPRLPGLKGG